jgi:hypothetical protein
MKQPTKYIEFKSPTQWITDVMAEIDPNLKTFSAIESGEKFADYMWDLYTIQCAEHNQSVKVYEVRFKFLASEYFHKNRRPK